MQTLTDLVMNHVRDAVNSGKMQSGELYSVYRLADELGISRSPVRDGLLRLEEAGLIEFRKNRGFQIVDTKPEDVAEIFSLRLGIEPPAAFRAAIHRTAGDLDDADALVVRMREIADARGNPDEFFQADRSLHSLILRMGKSDRGDALVSRLRDHTRILGHSTAGTSRTLLDILTEHEPIIEAIRAHDPEAAREAMHNHICITGKLLLSQAVGTSGTTPQDRDRSAQEIWTLYTAGTAT